MLLSLLSSSPTVRVSVCLSVCVQASVSRTHKRAVRVCFSVRFMIKAPCERVPAASWLWHSGLLASGAEATREGGSLLRIWPCRYQSDLEWRERGEGVKCGGSLWEDDGRKNRWWSWRRGKGREQRAARVWEVSHATKSHSKLYISVKVLQQSLRQMPEYVESETDGQDEKEVALLQLGWVTNSFQAGEITKSLLEFLDSLSSINWDVKYHFVLRDCFKSTIEMTGNITLPSPKVAWLCPLFYSPKTKWNSPQMCAIKYPNSLLVPLRLLRLLAL